MKLLNKNKKVFKIGKDIIVIDIIEPPLYYCQDTVLTEYDLRNIQRQIALGDIPHTAANIMKITDERSTVLEFREDGTLENTAYGYDKMTTMTLEMIKIKRLKEKSNH
jgi:hypothetical protein